MITGEGFGKMNGGLFSWGKEYTLLVVGNLGDQLLSQSLLPCQGKPGVQSKVTVILFRHL